ncbi:DUF4426 domain-containing protein [Psychrosphaera sp. 1_MG-2023]|uniref:DUF4426 domain-containing protein n=1 Tax=Psychrosphaera algicola TaxID=3023714 RepID=A0ABT5FJM9_9GAMM|nr:MULTISPECIES: DUF4426 domain-containing protein [unclassified Psychrosphaera]MDC2891405.1 DUF4426 domain-containing protein [Psychrosphaera sp. G1-22]MDO6720507.1 DUF4426 domain-containing protein [Psychrosphaera sp. 1_MG-2023]
MSSQINLKTLCFICVMVLTSWTVSAEQKVVKGDWDIHYIAFPSSFLNPTVAKTYELQRSRYMGVVNISVLDNQNNDAAKNVYVTGTARNLLGQTKSLSFSKVKEGDAIYYLAQLKFSNEEIYKFDIDIKLGDRSEKLKFDQKFYVD